MQGQVWSMVLHSRSNGGEASEREVLLHEFPGFGGIAMGMYNHDESIRDFARACFNYASRCGGIPVYHVDEEHDFEDL